MKNKKIYLIGGGIVALAVLIVLLAVLMPNAIHKVKMEEMLDGAMSSVQLSVRDPLFETGDVLGNRGKELLLSDEDLLLVKTELKQISEGGYRGAGVRKMPGGTMAMSLKARTDTNETLILYFEETRFYYVEKENAMLFEAKDEPVYQAFYRKLQDCLKA
jgi:hypothetical protein